MRPRRKEPCDGIRARSEENGPEVRYDALTNAYELLSLSECGAPSVWFEASKRKEAAVSAGRQVTVGSSLNGCVGYAVESSSRRLGVVDAVLFGDDASQPSALSVRPGRFARGVRIIDAAHVRGVDARARRIAVSSDGVEIFF